MAITDPQFCEVAKQDGFDIRFICQPPNSPDFNILDLHISIQAWYRNYWHPTRLSIINVSLLTLCGKEIKQYQFS